MKIMKSCAVFVLVSVMLLSGSENAFADVKRIGSKAALQIALDEAELTADQVTDVDVELERSIRSSWYEVDFESEGREYEYRVEAYSGEILLAEHESEKRSQKHKRIGSKAALQAALDEVGLTADQVTDVDVEFERGLRSSWYEVDFESGRREYEYRVDAYTGEILSSATD